MGKASSKSAKGFAAVKQVTEQISKVVNGPYADDDQVLPDECILRRRDSVCIMRMSSDMSQSFPDVDIDPRFIFEHDTIESMALGVCGLCECPYCSIDSKNGALRSLSTDVLAEKPLTSRDATVQSCSFTQLVCCGDGPSEAPDALAPVPEGYSVMGPTRLSRAADGMQCVIVPESPSVWIGAGAPKGKFTPLACEQPCHAVHVSSFVIDIEPVSVGAFARFLNKARPPQTELQEWCLLEDGDSRIDYLPLTRGGDGLWAPKPGVSVRWPMIMVSWFGANAYSLWAHGRDWKRYRDATESCLPSEVQWEYAARGADPQLFPWGDKLATPALLNAAWELPTRDDASLADLPLVDVNVELGVSPFGLRHMAGNVWQWCRDTYDPTFYATRQASEADAWNRADGLKCERGGSWVGPACLARSSYRRGRAAEAKGRCLGFRCAAPLPSSLYS